jgi:hypothetical protein
VRQLRGPLAEELEEDISAERHASEYDGCLRILREQAIEHEGEIRRFAGMIKPRGSIRLVAAAAKDHQIGGPPSALRLAKKTGDIVRTYRSLEPVQKEESRRTRGSIETMEVDEIAVGRIPTLDARGK